MSNRNKLAVISWSIFAALVIITGALADLTNYKGLGASVAILATFAFFFGVYFILEK